MPADGPTGTVRLQPAYYQHHCPEQTLFYRWAQRLKRVFQFDISQCGCGGKVKLIASIEAALTVRQAADRMSDLNIVVAPISWGQCCHAGLSMEKPGKVNNSDSIHRTSDNKINSLCASAPLPAWASTEAYVLVKPQHITNVRLRSRSLQAFARQARACHKGIQFCPTDFRMHPHHAAVRARDDVVATDQFGITD